MGVNRIGMEETITLWRNPDICNSRNGIRTIRSRINKAVNAIKIRWWRIGPAPFGVVRWGPSESFLYE